MKEMLHANMHTHKMGSTGFVCFPQQATAAGNTTTMTTGDDSILFPYCFKIIKRIQNMTCCRKQKNKFWLMDMFLFAIIF